MTNNDPHELQRFLTAQKQTYETALNELQKGEKQSHWIWFIFPQVKGLGFSSMAQKYAIKSQKEAIAYLQDSTLSQRLNKCTNTLLQHTDKKIEDIMGFPDHLKLQSSMTLFASFSPSNSPFHQVLDIFYDGISDSKTLDFLKNYP